MARFARVGVSQWVGVLLVLHAAAVCAEEPATAPAPAAPQEAAPAMAVQDNLDISLEYTLTVDGQVVDSSDGRGPLHYIHGTHQIIPGLERALIGMKVGESKSVVVSPEDGYGKVDPSAIVEVPKTQLPSDVKPVVGMVLRGMNPDGQSFRATINEVKAESVVLDMNHPFAGKTLNFQVKVVGIAPPPAPAKS